MKNWTDVQQQQQNQCKGTQTFKCIMRKTPKVKGIFAPKYKKKYKAKNAIK